MCMTFHDWLLALSTQLSKFLHTTTTLSSVQSLSRVRLFATP